MSRAKKREISRSGAVWHLSAEEATLAKKPYINAHVCKTGAHGDAKYNRCKAKRNWQKQMRDEGPFGVPSLYGRKPITGTVPVIGSRRPDGVS